MVFQIVIIIKKFFLTFLPWLLLSSFPAAVANDTATIASATFAVTTPCTRTTTAFVVIINNFVDIVVVVSIIIIL